MHRAVLLALLAIPILVVMHIALFWQPIPMGKEMLWVASHEEGQSRVPTQFAIDRTSERGS